MNRCFLFVPADSERKLAKAADINVDALILDLEDAVAEDARPAARKLAAEFAKDHDHIWVRINPFDTRDAAADLEAVIAAGLAGIVLPKPRSVADVIALSAKLDELEQSHQMSPGCTRIVSLCTERVASLFSLQDYRDSTPRLTGLSWGAEDLSAEIGARQNRGEDGNWLPPYEMARTLCLFAAAAAEVQAIDTVFTDFRDEAGLLRYAGNAARDGFTGMLAIHPCQVDIIQQAFSPSADELEQARRVVDLFEQNPGAGTLGLDGRMLDRPHLKQALRVLELVRKKQ